MKWKRYEMVFSMDICPVQTFLLSKSHKKIAKQNRIEHHPPRHRIQFVIVNSSNRVNGYWGQNNVNVIFTNDRHHKWVGCMTVIVLHSHYAASCGKKVVLIKILHLQTLQAYFWVVDTWLSAGGMKECDLIFICTYSGRRGKEFVKQSWDTLRKQKL